MSEKRKIIEIYVTEDKKNDCISFDFEKCENSKLANETIKGLCMMFSAWKDEEDDLEVEYEDE